METTRVATKNNLYPVFLKLDELHTLVVGGGNVGLEKVTALLFSAPDANVTVIAPIIKDELKEAIDKYSSYKIIQREFDEKDLDGKDIVILATDNKELHA
jgi:siroheme synthase-like protein